MKRCFLLFSVLIFFVACKKETTFNTITVNDKYSIAIPDYITPCTDLHKNASLQYQNIEKDVYYMVIDERKKLMASYHLDYDIDLYYKNVASQAFIETLENGKINPPGRQEIDGHKALISEITGDISGTEVYYRMAIIETPYAFYQILSWTKSENKETYINDMIKFIESFNELPQPDSELPQPSINPDSVRIELAY